MHFAIANKRLVGVVYQGRLRVVEPHDYGVMNGKPRLLAYQLHADNADRGKATKGWRLFDVPKLEACEILEQEFAGSRGRQHQRHIAWEVVFARVG